MTASTSQVACEPSTEYVRKSEDEWRQEFARQYAARNCPGNVTLHTLMRLLEQADDVADEWLDAHGDECDCEFCTADHTADNLRPDVAGILWACRTGAS